MKSQNSKDGPPIMTGNKNSGKKARKAKSPAEMFEETVYADAAKTDLGIAALAFIATELDHTPYARYTQGGPEEEDLKEIINAEATNPASGLRAVAEGVHVNLLADGNRRYLRYYRIDVQPEEGGQWKEIEVCRIDVTKNPAFARWFLSNEQKALIMHALLSEGFQLMPSPGIFGTVYVALPSDKVAFAEIKKMHKLGHTV